MSECGVKRVPGRSGGCLPRHLQQEGGISDLGVKNNRDRKRSPSVFSSIIV